MMFSVVYFYHIELCIFVLNLLFFNVCIYSIYVLLF